MIGIWPEAWLRLHAHERDLGRTSHRTTAARGFAVAPVPPVRPTHAVCAIPAAPLGAAAELACC
jgi:hypothetical protein